MEAIQRPRLTMKRKRNDWSERLTSMCCLLSFYYIFSVFWIEVRYVVVLSWGSVWLFAVNIGNARLYGLEEDLGLVGNQYQVAVSILFITYCVCSAVSIALCLNCRGLIESSCSKYHRTLSSRSSRHPAISHRSPSYGVSSRPWQAYARTTEV